MFGVYVCRRWSASRDCLETSCGGPETNRAHVGIYKKAYEWNEYRWIKEVSRWFDHAFGPPAKFPTARKTAGTPVHRPCSARGLQGCNPPHFAQACGPVPFGFWSFSAAVSFFFCFALLREAPATRGRDCQPEQCRNADSGMEISGTNIMPCAESLALAHNLECTPEATRPSPARDGVQGTHPNHGLNASSAGYFEPRRWGMQHCVRRYPSSTWLIYSRELGLPTV